MKTPEEIAREAIGRAVRWEPRPYCAYVGDLALQPSEYDGFQREMAEDMAKALVPVVTEAIEYALRQCPVPGGMTEEELNIMRLDYRVSKSSQPFYEDLYVIAMRQSLEKAIDHIDHLHRVMHTPESESIARAYDEGYQKGCKAGTSFSIEDLFFEEP